MPPNKKGGKIIKKVNILMMNQLYMSVWKARCMDVSYVY